MVSEILSSWLVELRDKEADVKVKVAELTKA